MDMEKELGYSMYYVDSAKEHNIIYPDNYNDEELGFRASYFYLDGKAESLAGFDCFNVSPGLLTNLLENTVELAYMTIEGETHELLIFCQFKNSYRRMRGYAVCIDDIDGVKRAMRQYPNAFRACGGHTPDEYLKTEHKEVWKLLSESLYSPEFRKLKEAERDFD